MPFLTAFGFDIMFMFYVLLFMVSVCKNFFNFFEPAIFRSFFLRIGTIRNTSYEHETQKTRTREGTAYLHFNAAAGLRIGCGHCETAGIKLLF